MCTTPETGVHHPELRFQDDSFGYPARTRVSAHPRNAFGGGTP